MSEEVEKTSPKKKPSAFEKMVPFLLVLSIGLAFLVGTLLQKVKSLEQGGTRPITTTGTTGTSDQGAGDQGAAAPPSTAGGKLPEDQVSKIPAVSAEDHVKGSRNAQVFLIEYSDFECPFCQRFHPTAQQVVDEYDGQVAWVYRHFPLRTIHPKAEAAAQASECAAEQGGDEGFWAFTDVLFSDPTMLSDLGSAATKAGLNAASLQACVDSEKYKDRVEREALPQE